MEDNTAINQSSDKKKKHRWTKWFLAMVVVLAIVAFFASRYYHSQLSAVDMKAGSETTEEVHIPSGSSIKSIAEILEKQGIIKDALTFRLYTRIHQADNLQAGYYQLSSGQTTPEIVANLQAGGKDNSSDSMVTITIPEGSNLLQLSEIISNKVGCTVDDVFAVLEDDNFIKDMFQKYPAIFKDYPQDDENIIYTLEGYLYPATYNFNLDDDLSSLIEQMVANTNTVYAEILSDMSGKEYTFHELLTLSSIVEHETANAEDRRLIAGVFLNRLAIDMPLETNVSFSYLKGEHMETISNEDTEVDSPYNLYRYKGLGPGPINSPSIDSTEAVLEPETSDYYFFLSDIHTGKTYFSKTYEEHLEKREIYVNSSSGSS